MPFNMQGWEWVILIVLALLIFGGSRLAGAGKNAGRALREFKDETRQIKADEEKAQARGVRPRREYELEQRAPAGGAAADGARRRGRRGPSRPRRATRPEPSWPA